MANAALNGLIDDIRSMDTDLSDGGETLDIVTAIVAEKMLELAGESDDARIEGGLVAVSLLSQRAIVLEAQGLVSEEMRDFALDLAVEFSMALCRLHS